LEQCETFLAEPTAFLDGESKFGFGHWGWDGMKTKNPVAPGLDRVLKWCTPHQKSSTIPGVFRESMMVVMGENTCHGNGCEDNSSLSELCGGG
jgi:hypothetical protein